MGSTMKPTIFNDRVAKALRNWHHAARKHIKQSKQSSAVTPVSSRAGTPFSSRPGTPLHGMSPVHLLRHHRSELDSVQTSPRMSNFDNEGPETDEYRHREDISWSEHHRNPGPEEEGRDTNHRILTRTMPAPQADNAQHEIDIQPMDFSFDKRART